MTNIHILLILGLIFVTYYMYSQNDRFSQGVVKLPESRTTTNNIPKILYTTLDSFDKVPSYVWNRLKQYAPDYKIVFFDDNACKTFLQQHYGKQFVDKFNRLRGPFKADLFRYCLLYAVGGVYFDIKIVPYKPLNQVFNHHDQNLFYTCICASGTCMFQAILATPPGNPVLKLAFTDIMNTRRILRYHQFVNKFYQLIAQHTQKPIHPGWQRLVIDRNNIKLFLLAEHNRQVNGEPPDRHKGHFNVFDRNLRVFKSRYDSYPWKTRNTDAAKFISSIGPYGEIHIK